MRWDLTLLSEIRIDSADLIEELKERTRIDNTR